MRDNKYKGRREGSGELNLCDCVREINIFNINII